MQPEFQAGGSLLEVGSGAIGITSFVDESVTGVDIVFDTGLNQQMKQVKASATDLPWKDGAFPRVVSSDMLEHLPQELRARAIVEMIRVTEDTLFLACPCGDAARRVDRLISDLYKLIRVPEPVWLKEHLERRIPDFNEIRAAIEETGKPFREESGESVITHFFVTFLISIKALNQIWKKLFFKHPSTAVEAAKIASFPEFLSYRKLWIIDCRK